MTLCRLFLLCLLAFTAPPVWAGDVPLPDAVQEARARALFMQLRCVVCEGQSVADSNAALAADMRHLIRRKIEAGEADEAIVAFFVERYGDEVTMQPPFRLSTLALWLGPFLFLLSGLWLIRRQYTKGRV